MRTDGWLRAVDDIRPEVSQCLCILVRNVCRGAQSELCSLIATTRLVVRRHFCEKSCCVMFDRATNPTPTQSSRRREKERRVLLNGICASLFLSGGGEFLVLHERQPPCIHCLNASPLQISYMPSFSLIEGIQLFLTRKKQFSLLVSPSGAEAFLILYLIFVSELAFGLGLLMIRVLFASGNFCAVARSRSELEAICVP